MSIIRADSIKNRSGLGAPDFPNGITVTGIVTSTILDSSVSTLNVTGGHVNVGSNIQLGGVSNQRLSGNRKLICFASYTT